jgi:hypothetical protein
VNRQVDQRRPPEHWLRLKEWTGESGKALHKGLRKAESSQLAQKNTGRTAGIDCLTWYSLASIPLRKRQHELPFATGVRMSRNFEVTKDSIKAAGLVSGLGNAI